MSLSHTSPALVPEVGTLDQRRLDRLRRVGWLLDNSIPIPGTRFRLGIDQLIGLAPGIGDLIGRVPPLYRILEASRQGVPKGLRARRGRHTRVASFPAER